MNCNGKNIYAPLFLASHPTILGNISIIPCLQIIVIPSLPSELPTFLPHTESINDGILVPVALTDCLVNNVCQPLKLLTFDWVI